jgi:hypothetical protein
MVGNINMHECQKCSCVYPKNTRFEKQWVTFSGTESEPHDRIPIGIIPENVCPWCGTPAE